MTDRMQEQPRTDRPAPLDDPELGGRVDDDLVRADPDGEPVVDRPDGRGDGDELDATEVPTASDVPRTTDAPDTVDVEPDLLTRVGRRIVRRPVEWANRPWPTERIVRYVVTVLTLVITTGAMFNVVHLSPIASRDLVFDDTTPTGGDFGAHVWGPAFLRDHLLPSLRLDGWSMDWYAGMPAYRFYMVPPAIAIVLFDVILPYGVAMKLVSVLGLVTFPAACWAFGRLAAFRYPLPELFAFAGLAFALDESFSIYGGNLKSTMAGEFSFSIALSLGVLGIGVLAAGLRTGKYRSWAAILIALACLSHGIVAITFVIPAAIVFSIFWLDRTRAYYAFTVGITSLLLIMWWFGPFVLGHDYMTDMKYGAREEWWAMYFPLTTPLDVVITTLAVIGLVVCVVRRHLNGVALGVLGVLLAVGVYVAKDSLPMLGLLWNPRVLPAFYLVRYLLMVIGAAELINLLWNAARDRLANDGPSAWAGAGIHAAVVLPIVIVLGWMYQVLPFDGTHTTEDGSQRYEWLQFVGTPDNAKAQGSGWAEYNFRGYEGRREYYAEYHRVITTMAALGESDDPDLGCGRALWENSGDNGNYGTTMALMLLPFWTDGCIGSMEGLFFEASGTTPYHFLTAAAMSKQSSNPVRELRYVDNDAELGVRHLQDLGVKYAMVRTPEAQAQAAAQPELTLVGEAAPWQIYQVADADVVVPLDTQPVVVNEREGDQRERFLELGTSWFQHQDEWAAVPATDGPDEWQRIDVAPDLTRRIGEPGESGHQVDIVTPTQPIEAVPLPEVTVSDVVIDESSIAFDVDQVGVPVLVKVSYFPNWEASGAEGPYRVAPNMMVVVPTETRVELDYGRSAVDYASILLTLVGIGLLVLWRVQGDVRHADDLPAVLGGGRRAAAGDEPDDEPAAGEERADAGDDAWRSPPDIERALEERTASPPGDAIALAADPADGGTNATDDPPAPSR